MRHILKCFEPWLNEFLSSSVGSVRHSSKKKTLWTEKITQQFEDIWEWIENDSKVTGNINDFFQRKIPSSEQ